MSRKVLLATIQVGGGHTALRDSFVQALQRTDPRGERYAPLPWESSNKSLGGFYEFVIHRIPRFQQTVYDLSDTRLGIRACSHLYPSLLREAREVLLRERPDAVICTHLVLSMMFARARRQLRLDLPLISAIPDYGSTTRGFFPAQADLRADYCVVMDPATRRQLISERGFPPEMIHLSGFLTRAPFTAAAREGRPALWARLSAEHPSLARLAPARPTLLFLGGSAWTSKTSPVIDRVLATPTLRERVNLIVVCGKNPEFEAQLRERTAQVPNAAVFGFVSAELLAALMAASTLPVLGSLAPATLQELLETGCGPLLLFHYIRGTEGPHVDYIEEHQLGLYEPDAERMVEALAGLTGAAPLPARLAALRAQFPGRARVLREESVQRAGQLVDLLDRAFAQPRARVPLRRRLTEQPAG